MLLTQKAESKPIKKHETGNFTGRVYSVSFADPSKGSKSELIAIDEKNKRRDFLIISTTTMYDSKLVPITLDKIKKGDIIKVKYTTTKEGVDKAISVIIVP